MIRRLCAAAMFAGLVLCAGAARAHAFLKTASPPVGSTVQQAPAAVTLRFTEGVEPAFSTITVQDAGGAEVSSGPVRAGVDASSLAVGVKPLTPGAYTVTWHAVSVDTHRTEGRFSFTVAP